MSSKACPLSVMFTCKDMKKSLAFYRDRLGFQLEQSWPDADAPQWANLMLDGQSVMLGAAMSPDQVGQSCHGDEAEMRWWKEQSQAFQQNRSGVGVMIYVQVKDVDRYHADVSKRGAKPETAPKTQFYGIRDFGLSDPDGYRLVFYTAVTLASCQSCGMPLTDAQPGQMYCAYCTDEAGKLKPYDVVLEGTTAGYFMGMKKMPRPEAEKAAREHLSKMPAWAGRR